MAQAVKCPREIRIKSNKYYLAKRNITERYSQMENTKRKKRSKRKTPMQKALFYTGIALCVIFGFMLVCNIIIIVKGALYPEKPPSVFGISPMVVLTGSMEGDAPDSIAAGDLIFVVRTDPDELNVGDIIAFGSGKSINTHRIIEISADDNGERIFITKGDVNNAADPSPVYDDDLVGKYKSKIKGLGDVVLFMQTPLGMLLFIAVPLLLFIVCDMIRTRYYAKKKALRQKRKQAAMKAEMERLRAIADGGQVVEAVEAEEAVENVETAENADAVETAEAAEAPKTETAEEKVKVEA